MRREVTTIRLSKEIRNILTHTAKKSGRTLSELVREAVHDWIEKREKEKAASKRTA
ncbi:ribbon-helix-helix protein, CopG family [Thermodesulfovibrio yellowstonii]|jgi:predicted transcriptional regulator|uniref:Ribbon-helix-helix protein, CopG family n=1 Tax=Thermodesulfovibrio yellowstonii (strain ATCC 51303 / DSM 11347 / YP87) TaxID=289376 RepID=B5YIH7_THEYD|nr:DUF6290 family protein [Thermodesulfovibrio yellowstonii]ACI20483.1 ribbon-helix-helix protein, CopG family [Thermodesulfovibrio yellowstonii DSM 11347]